MTLTVYEKIVRAAHNRTELLLSVDDAVYLGLFDPAIIAQALKDEAERTLFSGEEARIVKFMKRSPQASRAMRRLLKADYREQLYVERKGKGTSP